MQQTVNYVRNFISDRNLQRAITNRVLHLLYETSLDVTPPELGKRVYRLLKVITRVEDPFQGIKQEDNQTVLKMYQKLKWIIYNNGDPIKTAAKLAIAGNLIDYGANNGKIHMDMISSKINQIDLAINDLSDFKKDLNEIDHVLYLVDNAGEIVLDKLFIEMIRRFHTSNDFAITVVVRGKPVINDATRDDAKYIGMDKVANIIDNGDDAPGTILKDCSSEMKKYYKEADLIISKGQGNYETLSDEKKLIYFFLQAKCPIIAKNIGVQIGDLVLMKNTRSPA